LRYFKRFLRFIQNKTSKSNVSKSVMILFPV
jgi:hypothetical protein